MQETQHHTSKAQIRRFFEDVLNRGSERAAIDLLAPDFVTHHPAFPEPIRGPQGVLATVEVFRDAFPDLRYKVDALVAESDMVVARWTARGTHAGAFQGVRPTGRVVTVTGMDMFRMADGRCMEAWVSSDLLGLMRQLGALPGR